MEESFRTYPVKIRLQCGSDTYIVNGSTFVGSEFSQSGPAITIASLVIQEKYSAGDKTTIGK